MLCTAGHHKGKEWGWRWECRWVEEVWAGCRAWLLGVTAGMWDTLPLLFMNPTRVAGLSCAQASLHCHHNSTGTCRWHMSSSDPSVSLWHLMDYGRRMAEAHSPLPSPPGDCLDPHSMEN